MSRPRFFWEELSGPLKSRHIPSPSATKNATYTTYNIFSPSPLRQWCVLYREGGPEALIQKKRGHPKGYKAKKEPLTREQKLEAMVRRLQIEIAVLKKAKALKASRSLKTEIKRQ